MVSNFLQIYQIFSIVLVTLPYNFNDTANKKMIEGENKMHAAELWGIVAMGSDNAIGRGGDMPWHLPEDLRHFKALTLGHPVIMGRRTWESLPKKPLPGRLNIIVSRKALVCPEVLSSEVRIVDVNSSNVIYADSVENAVNLAKGEQPPFIIGGSQIYMAALPLITRLFITRIDTKTPDADSFFPHLDPMQWHMVSCEGPFESKTGLKYSFEQYERIDHK